ncbi:glycoside hydrolase family 16 protein [Durotheca rogersii]|uniref:glycoside hydrolase family 16 protein n=1 Tax=Durotheca rogersii TaxID=419775 RepID=UPI00221F33C4|nr:glycoside hydrolase family 16 protein [Durotheca rogersii]KAI5867996.1 glycoside hydrolase family 16 protein [Durotheca rogersii]
MTSSKLVRLLAAVTSLARFSMADYPEVTSDQCDCYLTNGSSGHYFRTHQFFDFRDREASVNVPALIDSSSDTSDAPPTNDYLRSDEWTQFWTMQGWTNAQSLGSNESDASVLMVQSPNNIYFQDNRDPDAESKTYLTLRTARQREFQSSAEFVSVTEDYHYLSARMYARTIGAPGAVTAMFTYRNTGDDATELETVQESDLELRTMDPPGYAQYTNQPSYTLDGPNISEATRNATIPRQKRWSDWATYRMDWGPGATTWFIDGVETASIAFQVPRDPSMLIFNAWSNGGSWTGNMSVGSEAYLQIQWIELVYNRSTSAAQRKREESGSGVNTASLYSKEKRAEEACHNVCSIDETTTTGTAVLMQGGASRALEQIGGVGAISFWVTMVSIIALAL